MPLPVPRPSAALGHLGEAARAAGRTVRDLLLLPTEIRRTREGLDRVSGQLDEATVAMHTARRQVAAATTTVDEAERTVSRESDQLQVRGDRLIDLGDRLEDRSEDAVTALDDALALADQVPGLDRP